ncbi:MAG: hypothetical protein ACFCVG_03195 [Kineosporiaceae bacterium]
MLRLLRAGSGPGGRGPAVRVLAALLVLGLLVGIAPFLGAAVVWVLDVL